MRFGLFATVVMLAFPAVTAAQAGDVARGYFDGNKEGSRPRIVLPFVTSIIPGPVLALTSGVESSSNNQIVGSLVTQTAIAAAASYIADLALKPRPSKEQELELANQSPLYATSWRRGYREASGQRRLAARFAGIAGGALISALIYSQR